MALRFLLGAAEAGFGPSIRKFSCASCCGSEARASHSIHS